MNTFQQAREVIADYIDFYNHERIQLKTKLTPNERAVHFFLLDSPFILGCSGTTIGNTFINSCSSTEKEAVSATIALTFAGADEDGTLISDLDILNKQHDD